MSRQINQRGIELLHHFEGCRLTAYLCPANVWTIGWGNTRYENGQLVRQGERITQQRADELFTNILNRDFVSFANRVITSNVNQNQFSAIVSFAYNVGNGNLQRSTLLRLVNANPNNTLIRNEFMRWNRAGGRELAGLTRRRTAEADLYFRAV
jgi:lysozyme